MDCDVSLLNYVLWDVLRRYESNYCAHVMYFLFGKIIFFENGQLYSKQCKATSEGRTT